MTADPHNCTGEVFVSHYNNTNTERQQGQNRILLITSWTVLYDTVYETLQTLAIFSKLETSVF